MKPHIPKSLLIALMATMIHTVSASASTPQPDFSTYKTMVTPGVIVGTNLGVDANGNPITTV